METHSLAFFLGKLIDEDFVDADFFGTADWS